MDATYIAIVIVYTYIYIYVYTVHTGRWWGSPVCVCGEGGVREDGNLFLVLLSCACCSSAERLFCGCGCPARGASGEQSRLQTHHVLQTESRQAGSVSLHMGGQEHPLTHVVVWRQCVLVLGMRAGVSYLSICMNMHVHMHATCVRSGTLIVLLMEWRSGVAQ